MTFESLSSFYLASSAVDVGRPLITAGRTEQSLPRPGQGHFYHQISRLSLFRHFVGSWGRARYLRLVVGRTTSVGEREIMF